MVDPAPTAGPHGPSAAGGDSGSADGAASEGAAALPDLVAGRECGSCNVCCVALTIDDPELQKLQGFRCRNARDDGGCGIYTTRPQTCRMFYCGWRQFKWIRETLRPDRSGVLVRLHAEVSRETGLQQLGVIFLLATGASIKAEGLAESVAAAVASDVPVYVSVPGPPGFTSSLARINDVLAHPVLFKDKAAVLRILAQARAQGRKGQFKRIVLKPHDGGAAAAADGG